MQVPSIWKSKLDQIMIFNSHVPCSQTNTLASLANSVGPISSPRLIQAIQVHLRRISAPLLEEILAAAVPCNRMDQSLETSET